VRVTTATEGAAGGPTAGRAPAGAAAAGGAPAEATGGATEGTSTGAAGEVTGGKRLSIYQFYLSFIWFIFTYDKKGLSWSIKMPTSSL
jgi:hypothetical protein